MRNTLFALTALAFVACSTATLPAPVASSPETTVVATPCNPGHTLINPTLWMQEAAEYRAVAIGTYASARRALDAALADPTWSAEPGDPDNDPSQPPAVILDLDETAFDNSEFETRMIDQGITFDQASWTKWTEEAAATAVPGAAEFLQYAQSRGVTPFYVTNRDFPAEQPGTRRNLERLGFPIVGDGENLMMRGARPEWKSDKSTRRIHVASSYRVLLLLGDDLNDFVEAHDKNAAERDALLTSNSQSWGTRWFMLPNAMYGSWERAAIGSGGTPCEKVQRKIDALH